MGNLLCTGRQHGRRRIAPRSYLISRAQQERIFNSKNDRQEANDDSSDESIFEMMAFNRPQTNSNVSELIQPQDGLERRLNRFEQRLEHMPRNTSEYQLLLKQRNFVQRQIHRLRPQTEGKSG